MKRKWWRCLSVAGLFPGLFLAVLGWLFIHPVLASETPGSNSGSPTDPIIQRDWLDDPDSVLTPNQVLGMAWTPYEGVFSRGYTRNTTWLRVKVDPAVVHSPEGLRNKQLVLRIDPLHLDDVAVYEVARLEQGPTQLGDLAPPPASMPRSTAHVAVLSDAAGPMDILLKIRSRGSHVVRLEVMGWDTSRDRDTAELVQAVAFLVFMAATLLWAGLAWFGRRDIVLIPFIAQQLSAMGFVFFHRGVVRLFGPDWLDASSNDLMSASFVPLYATLSVLAHIVLLRGMGARKPERTWLLWLLVLPVSGLLLVLADERQLGLPLSVVSGLVMSPLLMFAACRIRSNVPSQTAAATFRLRALMVATYALMTVLTVPQILVILGLRDASSTNFTWFTTYSLISTLLMGGLLYLHSKQIDGLREDLERELADAKRQAEMESARVGEQSELVTMLTHELKTPLSVVSLALGGSAMTRPQMRERALRAVNSMQAVIDRCAQIARFDHVHPSGDERLILREIAVQLVLQEAIAAQKHADLIDFEPPPAMLTCRADRQLLALVLGNLLDNAIKYAPPDARVKVSINVAAFKGRSGIAIRVSNPVGRAGRPDVNHLFEKYHRGAHARHRSGSGLGLYLSHRLATRMDGHLSLLDGEEVCFELWLPS